MADKPTANPAKVMACSVLAALVAADGGLIVSFEFARIDGQLLRLTAISFGIYLVARIYHFRPPHGLARAEIRTRVQGLRAVIGPR